MAITLSKKMIVTKLTKCGVNQNQIAVLARDYEFSLLPLFLHAAARAGKIDLPPEDVDRRYEKPTPESALEAEQKLFPLVRVAGGTLVADPKTLPGGFVDRWEKLAELGSRIPPSAWERHFKLSPEKLVQLRCDDMTHKYLKESWRTATIRYRDDKWASALTKNPFFYDLADKIINQFPIETRERLALDMIASNGGTWRLRGKTDENGQVLMHTIKSLAWDWSEEFALALLPNLQTEVDAALPHLSAWVLEKAAIYFPVNLQSKFPASEQYQDLLHLKAELYALL